MKAALRQFGAFLLAWFVQVFIALDQLVNAALAPLVTWSVGWADETLSARAGRNFLKGRILARIFKPLIDFLFAWQPVDPTLVGDDGAPITSHCIRAYAKERLRRQLPPEYRQP